MCFFSLPFILLISFSHSIFLFWTRLSQFLPFQKLRTNLILSHPSPCYRILAYSFFFYSVHSSISLVFSVSLCVTTVSPFLQFQGGFGRKKKKKEVRRYVTLSNTALSISRPTLLPYYIYTRTCTRHICRIHVYVHTSHTHTHREHVRKQTRTRSHDFSSLGSIWPIDRLDTRHSLTV